MDSAFSSYKPAMAKKGILLLSGILWMLSSFVVINIGINNLVENSFHILLNIGTGLGIGIIVYVFLFLRISKTVALRIIKNSSSSPVLSFFTNMRSYFFIALLIGVHFGLNIKVIIPIVYLAIAYIGFGFCLFISSFTFFFSLIFFNKIANIKTFKQQ